MNNDQLVQKPQRPSFSSRVVFIVSILTILVAAILIILAIIGYANDEEQETALEEQTRKTNQLLEQNERTSQQAANYAYCNAVLLSQFTQSNAPISIDDLNRCVLNSFPESTIDKDTGTIQDANGGVTPPPQNISPSVTPSQGSSSSPTASRPSTGSPAPAPTPTPSTPVTPSNPVVNPQSPNVGVSPTPLTPGIDISLPCLNALGVLQLNCR